MTIKLSSNIFPTPVKPLIYPAMNGRQSYSLRYTICYSFDA
jgi:hypothetical protein